MFDNQQPCVQNLHTKLALKVLKFKFQVSTSDKYIMSLHNNGCVKAFKSHYVKFFIVFGLVKCGNKLCM